MEPQHVLLRYLKIVDRQRKCDGIDEVVLLISSQGFRYSFQFSSEETGLRRNSGDIFTFHFFDSRDLEDANLSHLSSPASRQTHSNPHSSEIDVDQAIDQANYAHFNRLVLDLILLSGVRLDVDRPASEIRKSPQNR